MNVRTHWSPGDAPRFMRSTHPTEGYLRLNLRYRSIVDAAERGNTGGGDAPDQG